MLTNLLMILSMLMLGFKKKVFWMVQFFFFSFFLFYWMIKNLSLNITNLSYFMGMDMISYGLILLSIWIIGLMLMASEKFFKFKSKYIKKFIFVLMGLLLMLILTFSSLNLFLFYLFFESSLIPTFFLILGWGYQPERLQAGLYLLFYTLFASLPLLLGILYLQNAVSMKSYNLLNMDYKNNLMYFCLVLAFLVKMPMFFVHLWLPKAHVEAPVSGSMILAGILLKLGGYGLLRIFTMIQSLALKYNILFYIISLIGGGLISLVCLVQVDMKSLIAYSSVAHMGIVISGLVTLTIWGFTGAYLLMIGHGLCSSGLFCISNMVYERTASRSLFINKGLMSFMPSLCLWWFLLSSSNMAAPPSLNLMGEIFLLNSIIMWSWVSMWPIAMLSFFSAAYSLYLFSLSQHGVLLALKSMCNMSNFRESLLLKLHWVPLNLLILKSDFFVSWI